MNGYLLLFQFEQDLLVLAFDCLHQDLYIYLYIYIYIYIYINLAPYKLTQTQDIVLMDLETGGEKLSALLFFFQFINMRQQVIGKRLTWSNGGQVMMTSEMWQCHMTTSEFKHQVAASLI